MENEYNEFIIDLIKSRIRALCRKLDHNKYPLFDDDKLTDSEVASIEAEIKHWKLEIKKYKIDQDF